MKISQNKYPIPLIFSRTQVEVALDLSLQFLEVKKMR